MRLLVQAALDYVGFKEGESDGTLLDGTSVGGGGTVVSALDSVAGTSTMKDDGSTVISTAVKEQEPSALATSDSPSAQTKISKKLRNKLKAKGLSESKGKYSDDDSTVKSSKSSGTTMSLVGSILPSVSAAIPDFGVMRRLGLKRKADDVKSMESSSDKKSKKKKKSKKGSSVGEEEKVDPTDDELLSDSEDEQDKEELMDKYDRMREKLGGDEELEKQGDEWLKFAAYVRKKLNEIRMYSTHQLTCPMQLTRTTWQRQFSCCSEWC